MTRSWERWWESLLHNGDASLLYQQLVKEDHDAVSVSGGLNWPLGNPFEFNGPTLLTTFIVSPPGTKMDTVLQSVDKVVQQLATTVADGGGLDACRDQDAIRSC